MIYFLLHRKLIKAIVLILLAVLQICCLSSCHTSKKNQSNQVDQEKGILKVVPPDKQQKKIIDEAYTWLGTPYKYAASEKGQATDCSGMVMKVYETVTGEKLPRNSAKQAEYCIEKDSDDVATGDLVFFATGKDADKISHVGIIVDSENFIHASSSKGVVVSKFSNNYYKRTFKRFGRVPCMEKSLKSNKKRNSR